MLDCSIAAHRAAIDHLHTVSAGIEEPASAHIALGIHIGVIEATEHQGRCIVRTRQREFPGIENHPV